MKRLLITTGCACTFIRSFSGRLLYFDQRRASGLLNKETYPLLETRDGTVLAGMVQGVSRFDNGSFRALIKGGAF